LDAYSPVAGEVTIAQLAFKCTLSSPSPLLTIQTTNWGHPAIIGFGLSAATNTWIASSGQLLALSEMAIITAAVLALAIPMFFWGARIRKRSLEWRAVRFVRWSGDRR